MQNVANAAAIAQTQIGRARIESLCCVWSITAMLRAELIISTPAGINQGEIRRNKDRGLKIEDRMKNAIFIQSSILYSRSSDLLLATTPNRIAVFGAEG